MIIYRTGYGEDSHAFNKIETSEDKVIKLVGVKIDSKWPFLANSDGDVVLHAFCRAIQSLTGKEILGQLADDLVLNGTKDSSYFTKLALQSLKAANSNLKNLLITQVSIQIEAKTPKLSPYFLSIRQNLQQLIEQEMAQKLGLEQIGISAMTGEGLTACGQGLGVQVKVLVTVQSELEA